MAGSNGRRVGAVSSPVGAGLCVQATTVRVAAVLHVLVRRGIGRVLAVRSVRRARCRDVRVAGVLGHCSGVAGVSR